jgi:hypothetical protein
MFIIIEGRIDLAQGGWPRGAMRGATMRMILEARLRPTSEQRKSLLRTMALYNAAANAMVETMVDLDTTNWYRILPMFYRRLRKSYRMPAALVDQAMMKATARYMNDRPNAPARFARTDAIVQGKFTVSWKGASHVSQLTLTGRELVPAVVERYRRLELNEAFKYGRLLYREGVFILETVVTLRGPATVEVDLDKRHGRPTVGWWWYGPDAWEVECEEDTEGGAGELLDGAQPAAKTILSARLRPISQQRDGLLRTLEAYNAAATLAAQTAHTLDTTSWTRLHALLYSRIRAEFGLPANLVDPAIFKAITAYRAVRPGEVAPFAPHDALEHGSKSLSWKGPIVVSHATLAGRAAISVVVEGYRRAGVGERSKHGRLLYQDGLFRLEAPISLPDPSAEYRRITTASPSAR